MLVLKPVRWQSLQKAGLGPAQPVQPSAALGRLLGPFSIAANAPGAAAGAGAGASAPTGLFASSRNVVHCCSKTVVSGMCRASVPGREHIAR